MYKGHFKRWGLRKNIKAADVADVLRKTAATELSAAASTDILTDRQLFLVNGRKVSAHQVKRYIYNRCRQSRLRPDELFALLLESTPPAPLGLGITSAAILTEETAYRTIRDYFDGSLAAGRWTFVSEADCDLATEGGAELCQITSQCYERFKTAAKLLAEPGTPQAAEGVKMTRICFAELPSMLDHRLGPEDPILVVLFLIVLQHIRKQGEVLRWLEVRLVRYIADLSESLLAAQPSRNIWAVLRDLVLNRALTDHLSLQMSQVAIEVCQRHLGPYHGKTLELLQVGNGNLNDNFDSQEAIFTRDMEMLDRLGTFDERHAGLRMNLASLYNMHMMPEKAARVSLGVVENPWMLEQSKRYRGVTFRIYSELGLSCQRQGKLEEAEEYFRSALDIAKWEVYEDRRNNAHVLEGFIALEECLREMGKEAAATKAGAEREIWIRNSLESVGENIEVVM